MTKEELQRLTLLLEAVQHVYLRRGTIPYMGDPPRILGEDHSELISKFRDFADGFRDPIDL